jgi:N-acetylglucosaminyldiphosphoundecaprenol N-acetyl-beta-D-mannosaminyltransferase
MVEKLRIVSLSIHHLSFRECLTTVMQWAKDGWPSYVCFANVHMTIEAYKSPAFLEQLDNASLVVADGKPLATACYALYRKKQERISGMDFMPAAIEMASTENLSIFLFGSSPEVLDTLHERITRQYPSLRIAGMISPPFRPLTREEEEAHIGQINGSGAQLVFVSLGCPKQEKWMATHYKEINAVLLGVGGAFPVMAGLQRRAPRWMQNAGLEWFYRLLLEPGRMFRRYFETNCLFLYLIGIERWKQLRKRSRTGYTHSSTKTK